jgi:hypothetical protein
MPATIFFHYLDYELLFIRDGKFGKGKYEVMFLLSSKPKVLKIYCR